MKTVVLGTCVGLLFRWVACGPKVGLVKLPCIELQLAEGKQRAKTLLLEEKDAQIVLGALFILCGSLVLGWVDP